jgi:DNA-binding response OmpR family regulator
MKMPAKEIRVLVVDDEPTIADTLAVILRQSGFETHTAYSGEGAVRLSIQIKPDLMISDVMMPDKNGIDVASEVQALVPKCRVLFFSGQCSTATLLLKAKQSGKQWEVLQKPVHPHDLLARVRDVVNGENNEIPASNGRAPHSSGEPGGRSSGPEVRTLAAMTSISPGAPEGK